MAFHDRFKRYREYFQRARMRRFVKRFAITDDTRIIDVGGMRFYWDLIPQKPHVTMVNIVGEDWVDGKLRYVVYDGMQLPFADNHFDVAYSNSVIEHVGDASAIARFAREVRRMSPNCWIQTPNRYFPIEPHVLGVIGHWLPFSAARRLVRYFSLWGLREKPTQTQIDNELSGIHLLTAADMRRLFPDLGIWRERFLGMTKSIIAVTKPPAR